MMWLWLTWLAVAAAQEPPGTPTQTLQAGDRMEIELSSESFTMVYAPPGEFVMGSPENQSYRDPDETAHSVTLTQGFYVATTPVTVAVYEAVMGRNPFNLSRCKTCPKGMVNWYTAVKFANALSKVQGLEPVYRIRRRTVTRDVEADGYRLLTEAEWEYAARAGGSHTYAGSDRANRVAWYDKNSRLRVQPVATKAPNAWGIHDMSGNVWEWTGDWYTDDITEDSIDPLGPAEGELRVFRGGCVEFTSGGVRVANRSMHSPYFVHQTVGMRLARNGSVPSGSDPEAKTQNHSERP